MAASAEQMRRNTSRPSSSEAVRVQRLGANRLMLSVAEAAEEIGVSRAYAYQLVASGQLPSVTLGRLRRIRRTDLEFWVANLPLS